MGDVTTALLVVLVMVLVVLVLLVLVVLVMVLVQPAPPVLVLSARLGPWLPPQLLQGPTCQQRCK